MKYCEKHDIAYTGDVCPLCRLANTVEDIHSMLLSLTGKAFAAIQNVPEKEILKASPPKAKPDHFPAVVALVKPKIKTAASPLVKTTSRLRTLWNALPADGSKIRARDLVKQGLDPSNIIWYGKQKYKRLVDKHIGNEYGRYWRKQ